MLVSSSGAAWKNVPSRCLVNSGGGIFLFVRVLFVCSSGISSNSLMKGWPQMLQRHHGKGSYQDLGSSWSLCWWHIAITSHFIQSCRLGWNSNINSIPLHMCAKGHQRGLWAGLTRNTSARLVAAVPELPANLAGLPQFLLKHLIYVPVPQHSVLPGVWHGGLCPVTRLLTHVPPAASGAPGLPGSDGAALGAAAGAAWGAGGSATSTAAALNTAAATRPSRAGSAAPPLTAHNMAGRGRARRRRK